MKILFNIIAISLLSLSLLSISTIIMLHSMSYAHGYSFDFGYMSTSTVMTTTTTTSSPSNNNSNNTSLASGSDNLKQSSSSNESVFPLIPSTSLSANKSSTSLLENQTPSSGTLANKSGIVSNGNSSNNNSNTNEILGLSNGLGGEKIPNQYMVMLKSDVSDSILQSLASKLKETGAEVLQTYNFDGFKGFSIKTPSNQVDEQVLEILRNDSNFVSLVPDITMEAH